MLLDDVADYLSSGIPTLVQGTNLYKGFLPDTPDTAVALYETGGRAPVHAMNQNPGQAVVELPHVQVVSRSTVYDYSGARATLHSIFKLLDGMPARTINGVAYKWAQAVSSPYPMGRDAPGRVLQCCNFEIVKEMTP